MKVVVNLILTSLALTCGYSVFASQLCDANTLSNCSLTDENGPNNRCLKLFHACGHYREIISHFSAEYLSESKDANYFKGISYYGLVMRSRAKSLKCDYRTVAIQELQKYLNTVQEGGFRDLTEFKQSYHASKILKDLKKIGNCVENGLTEDQIEIIAKRYSDTILRGVFISDLEEGGLKNEIDNLKSTIRQTIGGFISVAANTETQIAMREVALNASQKRIKGIVGTYNSHFGEATPIKNDLNKVTSITFNPKTSSGLATAKSKSDLFLSAITNFESDFYKVIGNQSIADYEKSRLGVITRSKTLTRASAEQVSLTKDLLSTEFDKMQDNFKQIEDSPSPSQTIEEIYSLWQSKNGTSFMCRFVVPKPWYCNNEEKK